MSTTANRTASQTAPSGSGSGSRNNGIPKAPLFRPKDADEDTKPVITLDDDDDEEDEMWNQMDTNEPEFSQMAVELEQAMQSTQQQQQLQLHGQRAEGGSKQASADQRKDKGKGKETDETMREDSVEAPQAVAEPQQPQQQQEVVDMSLDVEDDDSVMMPEEEPDQEDSSRTKRRKKVGKHQASARTKPLTFIALQNWQLGLT